MFDGMPGALIAIFFAVFTPPTNAECPKYKMVELPGLDGWTQARAINNRGLVGGRALVDGRYEAVVWEDGRGTVLPRVPPADLTVIRDINDSDVIVGYSGSNQRWARAVRWDREGDDWILTELEPWTDDWTEARSINEDGLIVGNSGFFLGDHDALLWDDSGIVQLPGLGHPTLQVDYALGVNEPGCIVGTSVGDGNSHAVSWKSSNGRWSPDDHGDFGKNAALATNINDDGIMTVEFLVVDSHRHVGLYDGERLEVLDDLGGNTHARAINSSGSVVGRSYSTEWEEYHAVQWIDGDLIDLHMCIANQTEGTLYEAHDINDNGWIVGVLYEKEISQAVILVPVIQGDVDGDGDVDFSDLIRLLNLWGPCHDPCAADFDGDGKVSFADLLILLNNWS